MPTLNGTGGNDYIDVTAKLGTGVAGLVYAGAGADRVVGGTGNDTLYGGDGNDQLVGNAGSDLLYGGEGADQISGGADNDTLQGENGNDTLGGDAGDDSLVGAAGADFLNGGDGNDTLDGGEDDDSLSGNAGIDLILAGSGNDRANGGAGNDTIYGGLGNDTVDGNLDDDLIYGEEGNDTLLGGDGNDTVDGGAENDIVMGGAGDDLLYGDEGDDTLEGGTGRDTVFGGAGDDLVKQTVAAAPLSGLDVLDGGDGTDTLQVALTLAQWQSAAIQADIAGLSANFASPLGQTLAYTASSLGLSAIRFEKLIVSVAGNYAPTDITLSDSTVAANVVAGAVGTLSTTDATTGDTFTYAVDDNRFEVVAGVLKLKAGLSLDHEVESSVALNVTSTDSSGLSITRAFTVTVTNVDEGPSITSGASASTAENVGTGTAVYTATGTDPENDAITWSIVGGADAARFNINASTGAVTFAASPDYESPADAGADNVYNITIQALANGKTATQNVAIGVTNVNEAPTNIALSNSSIAENVVAGTIGTLTTTDPDAGGSFTYSLLSNPGSNFAISGNTLSLAAGKSLDYETLNNYSVTVRTTDQDGLFFDKTLTIAVTNVNEAPTNIALSNSSIAENVVAGTIGTLTTTDPDAGGSFTYSLLSNPGSNFAISGNTLSLAAGKSLDYETLSSYSVTVRTTDQGGLFFDKTFTVGVTNVNEAPTNIALSNSSIAENVVAGTIGTLTTTDPDAGGSFTYSLLSNPGSNFAISGNTLSLAAGKSLDYETLSSYSVTVRTTDQDGLFFDKTFTVGVTNVNEAPILVSEIPDKVVAQNAAFTAFSIAGFFSDPDGTTPTYSLVSGSAPGVTFNAATGTFSGTPTALGSYNFTVQASDGTFSVQDTFRISVVTSLTASPTTQADRFDLRGTSTPVTLNLLSGADTVFGGSGNDIINGDAGIDSLYGGGGDDTLAGGANDDILIGGAGNDSMTDGNGNADIFVFIAGNNGIDRIGGLSDKNSLAFGAGTGVTSTADFTRVVDTVAGTTKITWSNAQSSGDVTLVGYTGTVLYLYNYDVSLIA